MGWAIFWVVVGSLGTVVVVAVAAVLTRVVRRRRLERDWARALREFRRQREYLEAEFLRLAAQSGKPRGLRWTDCDFQNEVLFAKDRRSAALWAFAPVTISFEAIEGGGMEEVEAVGNLRAATAVFHWMHAAWRTEGRALFNLEPAEAIQHFQHELEPLAAPHPGRSS
ncbi:MAG: hypothetical protein HYS13_09620 [Planctomycetia bacterium]|nr:hypothetical protein [Planctomycetia bacterium]